ncbi:hypothetical protein ACSBR2_020683 [Camellia fascicularis]
MLVLALGFMGLTWVSVEAKNLCSILLPGQCPQTISQEPCLFDGILEIYSPLHLGLLQLVYVLWFYPLYIFSFIISSMWYNVIANYGFLANAKYGNTVTKLSSSPKATQTDKPTDLGGVMIGIAKQVYSVLVLNVFFLEVVVIGFIPYIGKVLNFLLISWMYANYCFEYKRNFSGLSLDKRLDFVESNWAFFAGFEKRSMRSWAGGLNSRWVLWIEQHFDKWRSKSVKIEKLDFACFLARQTLRCK